eukprot:NODE_784_length_4268_cov_0.314628.p3 type:complete len:133 gc:universal NODE_784_length_4268_cov_0.314628:562-960(+)
MFYNLVLADAVSEFKNACIGTCGAGDLNCLSNCDILAADKQAQSTNTTSMLFLTDCLKNCKPADDVCRNTCITMDPTYRYQNLPNISWINNLPNTQDPDKPTNNGEERLVTPTAGSAVLQVVSMSVITLIFQ